ncbi:hypothetical protein F5H01DRAFT_378066 [Linnemannia elongata]|nr:hypothetical protein F5H01DRAFT_385462 [Linnemannia elongata]KAK5820674.1 hypothetical protein F5H01DRAFT_378066 [Linnemannia elongata]
MPYIILDLVMDTTAIDHGILYPQIRQQDPVLFLQPPITYESTMTVDVSSSWNAPTISSSSSTFSAPPLTTFTTRSTAINNTDETTMTHLSHCGVPQGRARTTTWHLSTMHEQRRGISRPSSKDMLSHNTALGVSTPTANMFLNITYRQWNSSPRMPNKDMLGLSTVSAFSTTAAKHSRGMPRDYKQAMRWLFKAAQKESPLYNNGQGVPQDYIMAPGQFSKATNQGHDGENWRL